MGKHEEKDLPKVEQLLRRGEPCLAICAGKDCARGGTKQVLRAAQATLNEAGLAEACAVILTRCQDYCNDGPVMTVMPGAFPYLEMEPAAVHQVILDHVRDGRPVMNRLPGRIRRKLERRRA